MLLSQVSCLCEAGVLPDEAISRWDRGLLRSACSDRGIVLGE